MIRSSGRSALRSTPSRHPLRVAGAATIVALAVALMTSVASAAPVITGTGIFTYNEGAVPLDIGSGMVIGGGTNYAGQSIEFTVAGSTPTEVLTLAADVGAITTNGVVSIVGNVVYLGNGSTADVAGSVDGIDNGAGGRTLRVNFINDLANPSFEDDMTGWGVLNQRIDLGVTEIDACATFDTSTYPAPVTNADNNAPATQGALSTTAATTGSPTEGAHAADIRSLGMITLAGFDVVHGPAIVSSEFNASAGRKVYFDWRGVEGIDDYHVFGYVIDSDCNQLEVLDATGSGTSVWTTVETTRPTTDTYRFVFVSGTFDSSGGIGGGGAGAALLIDNVRVLGPTADDAVVQQVAHKLRYANSSFDVAAARTVDVTVQSAITGTGFAAITVNIVPAPVVVPPSPPVLVDHGYLGVVPSRLWDSRELVAKPAAGSVRELVVAGQAGVPLDATAVVLNVTVDRPDGSGFVTVFPCGGSLPLASNVNFVAGQTVANSVTVAVGLAGKVCVYTLTTTHIVVDVDAAFASGTVSVE